MRAKIGKLIKPIFDATIDRFDQSTSLETHLEAVRTLTREAPGDLRDRDAFGQIKRRLDGEKSGDAGLFAVWLAHDPHQPDRPDRPGDSAPEAGTAAFVFTEEAWAEATEGARSAAWSWLRRNDSSEVGGEEVAELLAGFPPNRWFIYKRGVFPDSSVLLASLIRWASLQSEAAQDPVIRSAGSPALRGLVDVLDRLIKHIEVRRNDALPFFTPDGQLSRSESDARIERLRFAMVLFEASRVFGDLRYLNTAMKLVDRGLIEQRGRNADSREEADVLLAYLFVFCFQEELLSEVLTA